MSKLALIIKREFASRVNKKSFILMCLLTPVLLGVLVMTPILVNQSKFKTTHVLVLDETTLITEVLEKHKSDNHVIYHLAPKSLSLDEAITKYDDNSDTLVLHLPSNFIKNTSPIVQLYNKSTPSLHLISKIKGDLFDIRKKLIVYSTLKLDLQAFEERMNSPITVAFQGEGLHPQMKFYLSFSGAILMYLLVMIYGVQVLRGVQEEKNSRIVEIIISSVQPKTLLKGKIFGIGIVGLLQFFIIAVVTVILITITNGVFEVKTDQLMQEQFNFIDQAGNEVSSDITQSVVPAMNKTITAYIYNLSGFLPLLVVVIPILFLCGYFLYAAFFAVVGSVLDNESDSQSMIFPITIPLVISIIIGLNVMQNPDSSLVFWTSLFPLTSPIVMAARLPFINIYTDWWQIVLCILILILSMRWAMSFAARVYKTGILMYGQKPSYKTIWKWFKQSKS